MLQHLQQQQHESMISTARRTPPTLMPMMAAGVVNFSARLPWLFIFLPSSIFSLVIRDVSCPKVSVPPVPPVVAEIYRPKSSCDFTTAPSVSSVSLGTCSTAAPPVALISPSCPSAICRDTKRPFAFVTTGYRTFRLRGPRIVLRFATAGSNSDTDSYRYASALLLRGVLSPCASNSRNNIQALVHA